MPDVIDFLVLRQQFDDAKHRRWNIGRCSRIHFSDFMVKIPCYFNRMYDKYPFAMCLDPHSLPCVRSLDNKIKNPCYFKKRLP